jgi:hypothetical protein
VIDSRRRISSGELSFDDLLVLTRRLLQTQPNVRDLKFALGTAPVRRRVPRH